MSGETITLDVGGTLVKANKTTLEQLTYFQKLFEGDFKKSEIFLDLDYEIFRHVLNRIRLANYVYPEDQKDNINAMYRYLMSEPEKTPKICEFCILRKSSHYDQNTSFYGTYARSCIFVNIIMKFHTFSRLEISIPYTNICIVIVEKELYNYFKPVKDRTNTFFKMRKFMINFLNDQAKERDRIDLIIVGENAALECLVQDIQ